jgi:hypothetical protein
MHHCPPPCSIAANIPETPPRYTLKCRSVKTADRLNGHAKIPDCMTVTALVARRATVVNDTSVICLSVVVPALAVLEAAGAVDHNMRQPVSASHRANTCSRLPERSAIRWKTPSNAHACIQVSFSTIQVAVLCQQRKFRLRIRIRCRNR